MEQSSLDRDDCSYTLFCPTNRLNYQLDLMEEMGLVKAPQKMGFIALTPKGWERVNVLSEKPVNSKQAFVAMWFSPDNKTEKLFDEAIAPAIEKAGFKPEKVNRVQHNNQITDEIVALIRKSRFIVADFTAGCCDQCDSCKHTKTCKDKVRPRGGVYYEAGFAKGLGLDVIWLVQKDQLDQIHFDVRQHNFITYENAEDLKAQLYNRIAATIR